MKINFLTSFLFVVTAAVIFSGCMTPVTVQTDPPGAAVYCRGAGRAAYKYKWQGKTAPGEPVTFRVPYNAIKVKALWPAENGKPAVESEAQYVKLLFKEDPVITIKK